MKYFKIQFIDFIRTDNIAFYWSSGNLGMIENGSVYSYKRFCTNRQKWLQTSIRTEDFLHIFCTLFRLLNVNKTSTLRRNLYLQVKL